MLVHYYHRHNERRMATEKGSEMFSSFILLYLE